MTKGRQAHGGAAMTFADSIVHISFAGPVHRLVAEGKTYTFEMHPYCGPLVVNSKGDPIAQPRASHPFWEYVSLWDQQGQRVADGLCQWTRPEAPTIRHVGARNYVVVREQPTAEGTTDA